MRISMVSAQAVDACGQSLHVAELSAALCRQGHEVTGYARRDDADLAEFGRFLAGVWSRDRPDVVHAHSWMSGLASLLAARETDVPVVQTFHGLGAAGTSSPERVRLERLIGRDASQVAATCTDEVFELARLGLPRARISVVPSGVDLDHFTPEGDAAERGAKHRIVSVGRLVPRKGFATTISALSGVPDTELVIAGGPEPGRLKELAERCGVADRVHFLGHVSRADLPALLRSADLVVCTPWHEPFGIVPLEAMACGVAVVATAVGGLTDTIVDGVTGELIPPRRPALLASTLRRLLDDPAQREAYAVAGMDRARARYSWDRIAADILRVYEKALPEPLVLSSDRPAVNS